MISSIRSGMQNMLESRFQRWLPKNVRINGSNAWDPQVLDRRFYEAVVLSGTLGLGESYMKGWWDCVALDVFFYYAFMANLPDRFRYHWTALALKTKGFLFNNQKRSRATEVAEAHYDPSSDVILSLLDPYNQYTCGCWGNDCLNLAKAQERKLDLICRKLELKKGDRVLDIGCGWGGFARYAAEHYGCRVTGITIARNQISYAKEFCKGLPVKILYRDYRDMEGIFDKILTCGMGEHVGHRNYRTLAESVARCLAPDGLFLWHTIGKGSDNLSIGEPWIDKYIFPNGMIPTMQRIARALEGILDMVDMHEFGEYYDPTLMAWRGNLEAYWPRVGTGRSTSEYRMWYYYLSSCAAMFRARRLNLWQFMFRKAGGPSYASVR